MTAGQNRIPVNLDYAASTPMRAEALLAQREYDDIGFVMLIGAALNEVRHSKNHISKVIAGVLIVLLLFILLF